MQIKYKPAKCNAISTRTAMCYKHQYKRTNDLKELQVVRIRVHDGIGTTLKRGQEEKRRDHSLRESRSQVIDQTTSIKCYYDGC
jgi:hypothetical protein